MKFLEPRRPGSLVFDRDRFFNLGVGLALICRADLVESVIEHLTASGERAYIIGDIVSGSGKVHCHGTLSFTA